jgi:hypothetical protein
MRKHTQKWMLAPGGRFGPMQLCLAAGESITRSCEEGPLRLYSGGIIRCEKCLAKAMNDLQVIPGDTRRMALGKLGRVGEV